MDPIENTFCRLCFTNLNNLYHIYDDLGMNICDILRKYFGKVNDSNILPKYICIACYIRITSFHEYFCMVQEAQRAFVHKMIEDYNVDRISNKNESLINGYCESNNDNLLGVTTGIAEVYIDASELDLVTNIAETENIEASDEEDGEEDGEEDDEDDELPLINIANMKHEANESFDSNSEQIFENELDNEENDSNDGFTAEYVSMSEESMNDDGMSETSCISTEDIKPNIDLDLLNETESIDKEPEFDEALIEEFYGYSDDEEVIALNDKMVDSPDSGHLLQKLDPEFINFGSYIEDFDFAIEFAKKPRLESPSLPTESNSLELEICEICAQIFTSRREILHHLYQIHRQSWAKGTQCNKCNIWLHTRDEFRKHQQLHRTQVHKCPQCEKISPTANALKCHIRGVHTDRSHKCKSCDKAFRSVAEMKEHETTHTREKSFKCSYCAEEFRWRSNMYSHQKKHHPIAWNEDQKRKHGK